MSRPKMTKRIKRWYLQILSGTDPDPYLVPRYLYVKKHHTTIGHAAAIFAARWYGRDIDIKKLQRIVINSNDANAAYHFAKNVPGANIKKLAYVVMKYGDASLMRAFADNIPEANKQILSDYALVHEAIYGWKS
jgi:hypothetical protein